MVERELVDLVLLGEVERNAAQIAVRMLALRPSFKPVALCRARITSRALHGAHSVAKEVSADGRPKDEALPHELQEFFLEARIDGGSRRALPRLSKERCASSDDSAGQIYDREFMKEVAQRITAPRTLQDIGEFIPCCAGKDSVLDKVRELFTSGLDLVVHHEAQKVRKRFGRTRHRRSPSRAS